MSAPVRLRVAEPADVPAIAELFARSCRICLPFLRPLHTAEEDRAFFAAVRCRCRITLAERGDTLLGFVAESEGRIEHLYLAPEARGAGVGRLLLEDVRSRRRRLQLWCFAQNEAALRFYERLGFVAIGGTAGDNEQNLPDVLLAWQLQ